MGKNRRGRKQRAAFKTQRAGARIQRTGCKPTQSRRSLTTDALGLSAYAKLEPMRYAKPDPFLTTECLD